MCGQRPIYSVNLFSDGEEASVVYLVGCDVIMIMAPFSVIAKAMKVLNAQVQALINEKSKSTLPPDFHLGLADVYKADDIRMSNIENMVAIAAPLSFRWNGPRNGLCSIDLQSNDRSHTIQSH